MNALWYLASHDISIFNYLFSGLPQEVSGRGHKCLKNDREDLAFVTLQYPRNVLVHIHVSWIDPKKVRHITIVGEKRMVCWDDLSVSGPITLFNKSVVQRTPYYESYGDFQLLPKEGNVTIPRIHLREPLREQDAYFIECVKKRKNPDLADGGKGLDVVRVLSAIQKSIRKKGAPVKINE